MRLQGVACLLTCLGMGWPANARADAAVTTPPPGRLLPVADTMLSLNCTGAGSPTIVLEAGLGGNLLDWFYVQPLLAAHHRVCGTDRPGAGWSLPTDRPRTAAAMTEELHLLLQESGEPGPYVLVGHSFGGMLALHYARLYPRETVGLVLIDAMHPDQFDRFLAAGVPLSVDPNLALGHTPAAAALHGLPPQIYPLALALAQQDKAKVFIVREMRAFVADAHEVRAAGLPHVPARVLVHGNREWDQPFPDGRMEREWLAMQTSLAEEIGAPSPIIVASAGHQIHLDAPQAVVAVIEGLIATLPP